MSPSHKEVFKTVGDEHVTQVWLTFSLRNIVFIFLKAKR